MRVKRSKGRTVISGKNLRVRIKHKHGTTTVAQLAHELRVSRREAALVESVFKALEDRIKKEDAKGSGPAFDPWDPPPIEEACPDCKHSLENNKHGFDQDDFHMEGDKIIYRGACTYCRECNPMIFEKDRTLSQMEVVRAPYRHPDADRIIDDILREIDEIPAPPRKSLLWRIWDYLWN